MSYPKKALRRRFGVWMKRYENKIAKKERICTKKTKKKMKNLKNKNNNNE